MIWRNSLVQRSQSCPLPPRTETFYSKAFAICRQLIAQTIPSEINNQLPPTIYTQEPAVIVNTLTQLLQGATSTDHAILEQEAKSLKLMEDMAIKEYVQKHRALRT